MQRGIFSAIRSLFRMGTKASKTKPILCTSFPFLDDNNTIEAINAVHSLFILRGLPGSGKSTIAKQITEKYSGISAVASADDFKILPQVDDSEADSSRYNKLDQKIQQLFEEDKKVIVVDDTHHDLKRLEYLFNLARVKEYIVFIVNCRKEESNNLQLMIKNSHWEVSTEIMQQLELILKENIIPYYFGWFLVKEDAEKMRKNALRFLDQLSKNETFLYEFVKYVEWDSSKEFNLQEYFQKKPSILHCTTKFCNYGKVPMCKSYTEDKVVEQSLSKSFVLKVLALFVTPRTVGARVLMDEHQMKLWPEEEPEGAGSSGDEKALPRGSRSHITLACAPNVPAVQTGIDLLSILKIESEKSKPEFHITLEEGELLGLGEGMCIVNLPKPIEVNTIFSGFYAKKESTTE